MQLGGVVSSVVIGFVGGSLIRLFTGPLIELPNFKEVKVNPTQRVIFVPRRLDDGTIQYVLSRVEDADKPFTPSGDYTLTEEEWKALSEQLKKYGISNVNSTTIE